MDEEVTPIQETKLTLELYTWENRRDKKSVYTNGISYITTVIGIGYVEIKVKDILVEKYMLRLLDTGGLKKMLTP